MRKQIPLRVVKTRYAAGRVTATLILSLILLVGLACAQLLVHLRGGFGRATEVGGAILKEVAQKGLDSFLGRQPLMRYYLLQEGGQNVGFTLSIVEPEINAEGVVIYRGRELVVHVNNGEQREYSFVLANDLSWYQYAEIVHSAAHEPIRGVLQDYRQGQLECKVVDTGGRLIPIPGTKEFVTNLVCPPMVDFFSSMALSRHANIGGVFSVPQIMAVDKTGRRGVVFIDIWVTAGKDIPEDVKALGAGSEAQTQWFVEGVLQNRQSIYYDLNHQLIWQLDHVEPPQVRRLVGQEELRHLYPQAMGILDRWQENHSKKEPVESKELL